MVDATYRNYKSNQVKSTYSHEFWTDSNYNAYLRHFNEALLLIKCNGEDVIKSQRFQALCKKFDVKLDKKELLSLSAGSSSSNSSHSLQLKTQAYK